MYMYVFIHMVYIVYIATLTCPAFTPFGIYHTEHSVNARCGDGAHEGRREMAPPLHSDDPTLDLRSCRWLGRTPCTREGH